MPGVIDSLKAITRTVSRHPPTAGAEPFTRWWQWACYQQAEETHPFIT